MAWSPRAAAMASGSGQGRSLIGEWARIPRWCLLREEFLHHRSQMRLLPGHVTVLVSAPQAWRRDWEGTIMRMLRRVVAGLPIAVAALVGAYSSGRTAAPGPRVTAPKGKHSLAKTDLDT